MMKVDITIKEIGISFDAIGKNANRLASQAIKAGILRSAGKEKSGVDLVEVAAYNEFGTKYIPPRPFMRIAADKNSSNWQRLMMNVAARVTLNQMGIRQGQNLIGNQAVGDIQKVIGNRGLLAPNAPNTVKQKGSDAPLIDSGNLRQSVSFEVK